MVGRISLGIVVAIGLVAQARADDTAPAPAPAPVAPPVVVLPAYTAPTAPPSQQTTIPQVDQPEEITDLDEGRRAPVGYTPVQRRRKGLIIGGAITFGASWLIAVDFGKAQNTEHGVLVIPLAGPFLDLRNTTSATGRLLLAGLGAVEVAGVAMAFIGFTTTKTVYVRNDLVGVTFTPLGVSGRF